MKARYDKQDRSDALVGPHLIRQENAQDHIKLRKAYDTHFESMKRARYLPPDQLREIQLRKIQELVDYAYHHVPMYQKKYSAVGFQPGDLKTWDDFHRLPLLTKAELIEGWPDSTVSDEHDMEFMTTSSGSSGRFVYLAVSEDAVHFENLQMARQHEFQSNGQLGERDLTVFVITCPWWFTSTDGLYPQHFLTTKTPPEEVYAVIRDRRPGALSMYASYMRRLAAINPDLRGCGVRLIVVHSEGSSRAERKQWAERFGVDVRDEYSSEELIRMALECPHGEYHVEQDACYLEIVDPASGARLPRGEQGEVVGTNLVNRATPFIRYRQGDLAKLLDDGRRCPCGATFERMSAPLGRADDSFIMPNGVEIPAGSLIDEAYNWVLEARIPVNGLQYQIVQSRMDQVDVYLVTGQAVDPPAAVNARDTISRRMSALLGDGVRVTTQLVDEVPHRSGRKVRAAISLVDHRAPRPRG